MPIQTQGISCMNCNLDFDVILEPNYPVKDITMRKPVEYCPFCGEKVKVDSNMEYEY